MYPALSNSNGLWWIPLFYGHLILSGILFYLAILFIAILFFLPAEFYFVCPFYFILSKSLSVDILFCLNISFFSGILFGLWIFILVSYVKKVL